MKIPACRWTTAQAIAVLTLTTTAYGSAQEEPKTAVDWSAQAVADIRAAHEHMLRNHPGPVNPADSGFGARVKRALADSLELARQAHSAPMWKYSLKSYAAQFRDGHFNIHAENAQEGVAHRWPGFLVAWRSGKVLICDSSDPIRFPIGAEVVSCDGKAVRSCLLDSVFRFQGNPEIPGSWTQETPLLMWDDGNPYVDAPKSLELRLPDPSAAQADTVTRDLVWAEITEADNWYERRRQAVDGPRYPTSMEELPGGAWWIRLTDFQPDDAELARIEGVVQGIEQNLDSIRTGRAIIFDLRRNNGGSSQFPLNISRLLWGEGHASWRESQDSGPETYVEWRASQENIATMRAYIPMLEKQGWTEEQLDWVRQLIAGMSDAAAAGQELYADHDPSEEADTQAAPPRVENPVQAPVYVVISGRCASAALDAIDIFKRYDNVTLVGSATSADTNYMEIRNNPLPSGHATLYSPMKVYRNRKRAAGAVYEPDIDYPYVDWSDMTFQPWLLTRIP